MLAVRTWAPVWWWCSSIEYVVVYSGWEVTHASYVRLIKRKSIGPDPSFGGIYRPLSATGNISLASKAPAPYIYKGVVYKENIYNYILYLLSAL